MILGYNNNDAPAMKRLVVSQLGVSSELIAGRVMGRGPQKSEVVGKKTRGTHTEHFKNSRALSAKTTQKNPFSLSFLLVRVLRV